MRFIHTADWHLGRQFNQFSKKTNQELEYEMWGNIDVLMDKAESYNPDFILVVGDVFDDPENMTMAMEKLQNILNKRKTPIIILPGNHDPLLKGGIWDTTCFKEHVRIIDSMEPINIQDKALIYGMPWNKRFDKNETVLPSVVCNENINIAVHHGDYLSGEYMPLVGDLTGFDYVAMGHIHSFKKIAKNAYYPGAPHFLEMGMDTKKGFIIVDVIPGTCKAEFVPLEGRRVYELKMNASDDLSLLPGNLSLDFYKIELIRVEGDSDDYLKFMAEYRESGANIIIDEHDDDDEITNAIVYRLESVAIDTQVSEVIVNALREVQP